MKDKTHIVLGIVLGILNCFAWYLLARSKGYYSIEVYVFRNYIIFLLLVIGVFLSVYLFRKKNKGLLGIAEAMKTGLIYSLVFALILAIFNFIYYRFITPDTIDYFLSEAKKTFIQNNVKLEDIPKYLEAERGNFNSFKLLPPILFFGLISSLLAGLIMKKKML